MKPMNIRDFVTAKRPSPLDIQRAHAAALKRGYQFDDGGRCYAAFARATPRFPDGRKGRWQNGTVVERKRA